MYHNQNNSIIVNNPLDIARVHGIYEDVEKSSRRALLLSSEDEESMALASSKARLMIDLIKNSDSSCKETGSYYRGNRSDYETAGYKTPHSGTVPCSKYTIPTYPSLVQNIRWDPNIETYSKDFESGQDKRYHCRCQKCRIKRCRALESYQENKAFKNNNVITEQNTQHFAFSDNIMRFNDSSTMTPKFTDACCEVYFPLYRTPKTSEVYISTSDMALKDKAQTQTYTDSRPILKSSDCKTCHETFKQNRGGMTVDHDEAIRECRMCNDYEKLLNSIPKKKFDIHPVHAKKDNFENNTNCRTNLYNEGISDSIAENIDPQYLKHPMRNPPIKCPVSKDVRRFHSPVRLSTKKVSNRVTDKCIDKEEPWIPYSHRHHSRYHNFCKDPGKKADFRYDEDCRRDGLPVGAKIPMQPQASSVLLCDRQTSKLPKKLLTSERDIDSYIACRLMN